MLNALLRHTSILVRLSSSMHFLRPFQARYVVSNCARWSDRRSWGKNNLQLNVFFTPSAIASSEKSANDVYIVVDVIRATTSMAVMFDQGAARILVAGRVEEVKEA